MILNECLEKPANSEVDGLLGPDSHLSRDASGKRAIPAIATQHNALPHHASMIYSTTQLFMP